MRQRKIYIVRLVGLDSPMTMGMNMVGTLEVVQKTAKALYKTIGDTKGTEEPPTDFNGLG